MTIPNEPVPNQPIPNQPDSNDPVDYAGPRSRTSPMAVTSMILSIVGIPLVCLFGVGVLFCMAGITLGIISLLAINKRPRELSGKGFAIAGIAVGGGGGLVIIPLLVAILLPSLGRARELSNRSYCASNIRGIMQSCNIYAADNNDDFPIVLQPAGLTYTFANGSGGLPNADATIETFYSSARVRQGSVSANLWLLVLKSQVSPKQFICKSDPFAVSTAASITSGSNYLTDFTSDKQFSYSSAYPWTPTLPNHPAPWWRAITDSSLPLMADIAPMAGTGSPAANPAGPTSNNKVWNSGNHGRDGQNVGFSDAHAEFARRPDVGQISDNIWTSAGAAGTSPNGAIIDPRGGELPTGFIGGTPRPGAAMGLESGAYDIVMVPIRDLSSGTTR